MKAFKVQRDEDWPHDYEINAASKWLLPAVKCRECGHRGWCIGVRYASLALPDHLEAGPYLVGGAVTLERQKELRAPLLGAWGQDVRLLPGVGFGPLVGKAWGKCGDVGWCTFSMVLREDAAQRLREAGVRGLKLVPTQIRWRSRLAPDYFEVEIPATARFSPSWLQRLRLLDGAVRCPACGFLRREFTELPDRKDRLAYEELSYYPVLHAPSLPADWDLLRVQDWEATIVASEHFRNAALEVGLTNISFREIAVESVLLTC